MIHQIKWYIRSINTSDQLIHQINWYIRSINTSDQLIHQIFYSSADDIPPEVQCPQSIIKHIPIGATGSFVRWKQPTYTDTSTRTGEQVILVYDIHSLNYSDTFVYLPESFFPVESYHVHISVYDWMSNHAECRFEIIIGKICFYEV